MLVITIKRDVEIIGVQDESQHNAFGIYRDCHTCSLYNSVERKIDSVIFNM